MLQALERNIFAVVGPRASELAMRKSDGGMLRMERVAPWMMDALYAVVMGDAVVVYREHLLPQSDDVG
jgi:hypothetical protein